MKEFLNQTILNNSVSAYLTCAGTIIGGLLILAIIKNIVLKRLKARAEKTETPLDETAIKAAGKYIIPILDVAVIYAGIRFLDFGVNADKIISIMATALATLLAALMISALAGYFFKLYWDKKRNGSDPTALRWITLMIKTLVWTAAVLIFLENAGVQITALVAGLGIGGVAIAFALQAILADLFSFVTIFLDRPFEIDDFIIVDDLAGTVEHIGIKTTRIRSLSGEQLIFSNKDLTSSRLRNYKRMESRRVVFHLGVTYNTSAEKLKMIPDLLKDLITSQENVTFGRAHFYKFGDSSLIFEIVYFVLSEDYDLYMNVHQAINFSIKEIFDANGIEFAFPTQTIHLQNS